MRGRRAARQPRTQAVGQARGGAAFRHGLRLKDATHGPRSTLLVLLSSLGEFCTSGINRTLGPGEFCTSVINRSSEPRLSKLSKLSSLLSILSGPVELLSNLPVEPPVEACRLLSTCRLLSSVTRRCSPVDAVDRLSIGCRSVSTLSKLSKLSIVSNLSILSFVSMLCW